MYQIPISKVNELLSNLSCKNILIEAPIGLKDAVFQLYKELKNNYKIVISGDYVWGFCDTDVNSLKDYDIIIHLAHEVAGPSLINILRSLDVEVEHHDEIKLCKIRDGKYIMYVPVYYEIINEVLNRCFERLKDFLRMEDVELITYSLPFKKYAEEFCKFFKIECTRTSILGCFLGFKLPRKLLVISSGYFHALTPKLVDPEVKVYVLDIFRLRIENVDQVFRKYLALKIDMFFKACKAKTFAVLLCTKIGQKRLDLVDYVVKKLSILEREAYIVQVSNIHPDFVNNLPVDAIVNTACPRIGFDDLDRFTKPVINAYECEYLDKPEKYEIINILKW